MARLLVFELRTSTEPAGVVEPREEPKYPNMATSVISVVIGCAGGWHQISSELDEDSEGKMRQTRCSILPC